MNQDVKDFLLEKAHLYNHIDFIENDPIQIPHKFAKKEDIEISAFLTSTIAWGNRKNIIRSAEKMMNYMDNSPFQFVMEHKESDFKKMPESIHRTFKKEDFVYFIQSLKSLYKKHESLESIFLIKTDKSNQNLKENITTFWTHFFKLNYNQRTEKHIGNPNKNSACKKINMFLRWMVRKDNKGVDFGLWNRIPMSMLSCPLDVHSGRVAREYEILKRTQNDWKAVEELDYNLREINSEDPVLLDYALFGLGVSMK
ncbi:MAG: TIGR02757 family protein [Flavobacteriales bacterium]|nr:TIGR02757 family protein [Flavobacteriales bacterium]